MLRWLTTVCWIVVLAFPLAAADVHERSMAFDFSSGHLIRMKLAIGEYRIQGSSDDRVRVRLSSTDINELNKTWVKFTTDHGVGRLETRDAKKVKVVIDIPARTDLHVRLRVGELSVEGIEGHKDLAMSIGELAVDVPDPDEYRDVRASVRIGDLNAAAFQISKEGFFRSFNLTGPGRYGLRATLGIGDINIGGN